MAREEGAQRGHCRAAYSRITQLSLHKIKQELVEQAHRVCSTAGMFKPMQIAKAFFAAWAIPFIGAAGII
ncbi:MAG: hypothetical protein IT554_12435 [Sphingomonadaceae bacterium]|nr:hypothetical protein [Sphingobium sp.]MCC6483197.1 hypothetical protein [Sphingomonadaceae bacterium]